MLDLGGDSRDSAEASSVVVFLTDSRRAQKVLWRQLFVLDSMLSLVEELKSARKLLTQPCPAPPDVGARSRWKALKEQSRCGLEETENLLQTLFQKIYQIQEKRDRINRLLQTTTTQSQEGQQLQERVLKAQTELHQCELLLQRLQAERQTLQDHTEDWDMLRDLLQAELSVVQSVMNIKLLSLSRCELSLELSPGTGPEPGSESGPDLDPLRLTVKWGPGDSFTLQVGEDAGALLDSSSGRGASLRSVLLDVLQSYVSQAELLSEIQALRSSFAIDWRPSERRLVFLKSASVVYELFVEEGYPRHGNARLQSAHRDGLEIKDMQFSTTELSLSQWLLLLSTTQPPNQD